MNNRLGRSVRLTIDFTMSTAVGYIPENQQSREHATEISFINKIKSNEVTLLQ